MFSDPISNASGATPPPPSLRGRGLRFVLVDLLMRHTEATVAELITALSAEGYHLAGRPSKVISDALRWEVRRGRVARVARGRYAFRTCPRTTSRRIRLLGEASRAWLRLVAAGLRPPPARPDPRRSLLGRIYRPEAPPWANLGWLWVT